MDSEFWLQRWREGRTHFHQERVLPLLQKHWPTLALPQGSTVLVPLCGKSLDMMWLAAQGYKILGVELSALAVQQFFDDNGMQPVLRESAQGRHYSAGNVEIICGDIFDLDDATLAACRGAYDRAALIALPPQMRARYVERVYGRLAPNYCGLLITLEYEQQLMEGPPFAVAEEEVQRLYAAHTDVLVMERRDILAQETKFIERGLQRLDTVVYDLQGGR
ncbi:thiopurine S-methyltransferase [Herbaspirillum sp. YR522]|uniref:thiopurine S-methyltransferase n=1 Tax=Herbaspirillum sp. YR522 TaxID=1144342 RepID=UPI00026FC52C|nr:thiopurine S-methyltransferase [Herbaspirillum sp. YR522]EJM97668.1 thiopurine S-methyltransferase, Se/Te detoxification family [Herbaspirillum sp. YR522]